MVYESDFYTTRRPYRPSSYSVSVSRRLLTFTERAPRSNLFPGAGRPRTKSTLAISIFLAKVVH